MPNLIKTAAQIAATAHLTQERKSDNSPYIVHPFMVAMQLQAHGFADEVVAAALLHDVLEDTQTTAEELEAQVGSEVLSMVQSLSEDKELPWEARKELYIKNVVASSDGVKAISVADKLYNLNDVLSGLDREGEAFWRYFTRGVDKQKWFFRTFVDAIKAGWQHPLVDELEALVVKLESRA